MAIKANQPIGIFDSGVGGLTVARAVKKLLPREQLVYFGDLAHLPYGDKSEAAIQAYSIKIVDVLLKNECKVILIACNSASTAAYELVKEYVGKRAKVIDVINPVVDYVRENYAGRNVGLIGTKQTVSSEVYLKKVNAQGSDIKLSALATPLLVPLIEEGFAKKEVTQSIIDDYLNSNLLADVNALILGCTHYPLIKHNVDHHYKGRVDIIDSSEITAVSLKSFLEYNNLTNKNDGQTGADKFLVSDYTESFEHATRLFFGEEVHLEKYPLWE
jgi:glutamate racemase